MTAVCRTCDRWPATHMAFNPRDPRGGTWPVCRRCRLQAIEHHASVEHTPIETQEAG